MLIKKDNDNIYKLKKIIIWIYTLLQGMEHKIEPTMKPLPDIFGTSITVSYMLLLLINCCYFYRL